MTNPWECRHTELDALCDYCANEAHDFTAKQIDAARADAAKAYSQRDAWKEAAICYRDLDDICRSGGDAYEEERLMSQGKAAIDRARKLEGAE